MALSFKGRKYEPDKLTRVYLLSKSRCCDTKSTALDRISRTDFYKFLISSLPLHLFLQFIFRFIDIYLGVLYLNLNSKFVENCLFS